MKRLYFLTKNVNSTEQVADDLHREGITDWHFHVISRHEARLKKHHVHSAAWWHRFDILHSGERGLLIGGGIGFVIGLISALATPLGEIFGFWFVALPTGLCGLFGAWVGGMVGLSHENYKIARFHDAIEQGHYLLMVDIRKDQEARVVNMMRREHPEAQAFGWDSTWVSPFASGGDRSVYDSSDQPGHVQSVRRGKASGSNA